MKPTLREIRLKSVWLLVPLYLYLADPTPERIAWGAALALPGALLRAWASGTIRKNNVLTTGGPYAYTRNPLYLGSFVVGLGFVIAGGRPLLLAVLVGFFLLVYLPTMRVEERRLESLFGEEFRVYAESVPLFVPRGRAFRSGGPHPTRFQVERYLGHKEYEFALGIVAGFLILAAKAVWTS